MEWTEDVISRLRALWAEGHSTAEIGRRLGVSKNAIVGKAHRLDLPARPSPIRRDPNAADPNRAAPTRRLEGSTLPPLASTDPAVSAIPVETTILAAAALRADSVGDPSPDARPIGTPDGTTDAPAVMTADTPASPGFALPAAAPTATAPVAEPPPAVVTAARAPVAPPRPVPVAVPRAVPPSMRPYGRVITCCWPIGEPGTRGFRFCDSASEPGKPYCGEHAKIAYVKVRDRREDAA